MGLFNLCMVGGGFVLIGAWEAIITSYAHLNPSSPPISPAIKNTNPSSRTRTNSFLFSVSFIASAIFSFSFILGSLFSLFDAHNTHDRIGFAIQLENLAISSLFLLYSVVSLLIDFTGLLPLPSSILSLIGLFAFVLELLLFLLRRKDPDGVENRYFDLMLVPIMVCILSTFLELGSSSKSKFPRLARGVGLIMQGTWFIQMGFSFYTDLMAHGCELHEKRRGNYTVKCKGHAEYHRGRAIATLQFNLHLAFLLILIMGFYSIIVQKYGLSRDDYISYKPLGAELQQLENQTQFTLESDNEIKEEEHLGTMVLVPINQVNVYRSCSRTSVSVA